ncbi:hypothetical protein Rhopal_002416-T1 [Rhodotorula paludigena]|uniref:non-specific serine/threonine protein kinase n=1 Tax=Rhodotorula paludigena TaxID=86838 RepID=A0AAV5GA67_9BASI|nr:hypothetical protein Rhopal_002416-T1 [Rhodotorula paludigena]
MVSAVQALLANPRRRTLLPAQPAPRPSSRSSLALAPPPPHAQPSNECARLVTRTPQHGTQVLVVQLDRAFHLGRSRSCDYRIDTPAASTRHARVYALTADTGDTLVCLDDHSTNGTLHNDRRLHHCTVVLCDGDRIEIAGQLFRYHHTAARPVLSLSANPAAASASTIADPAPAAVRVGDFLVFDRTLGSGAFSHVHLALSTKRATLGRKRVAHDENARIQTLKQVACKKLQRTRVNRDRLEVIQREVDLLKAASHPNINRVEAVEVDEVSVYVLHLHARKWLLYQLLHALQYLHDELNIAHRDVKLENVILAHHTGAGGGGSGGGGGGAGRFPKVQLADFGQARYATQQFKSLQGTLQYMAPEQLVAWTRHEGYDGKRADMWATGILLALLLTGGHPFEPWRSPSASSPCSAAADADADDADDAASLFGASVLHELGANPADQHVCENVVRGDIAMPAMRFGSEDSAVRALLSHLLSQDPHTRLTAAQALKTRWFAASQGELDELYRRVVLRETSCGGGA